MGKHRFTTISDWNTARTLIRSLNGRFKSSVFGDTFKNKPYKCKFVILSDGDRLLGAMTYWKEHGCWHIGDFDTAAGTHGAANALLERFFSTHRETIRLWCWDDNAEHFWRYIAKKNGRNARKTGISHRHYYIDSAKSRIRTYIFNKRGPRWLRHEQST